MSSLAAGQPASSCSAPSRLKSYGGTVTRMAPLADRETREFLVDVTVKDLPKSLGRGPAGEVYIETARKDQALLAPQTWPSSGRTASPGLFVGNAGHATVAKRYPGPARSGQPR